MNICIVTEYFPHSTDLEIKGGVEVCAFNESVELSKYNNITVLTSNDENNSNDFYINDIHVICCGDKRGYTQKGSLLKRLNFMKDAYNVGKNLKDIDLVIGYNFITYPVAWHISQKLDIPIVARYHDVWIGRWINTMGITGIFGEFMERHFLKQDIDLILPVSDYTKNNLLPYFPENKIKTVHNIVDFPVVESKPYDKPTIACVARLVEYKRVEDLIKAVNIIKKEIPDIRCKIIGTGPLENELKNLTKELKLEDNIEFLGFVEKHEDVMKVVNSSDVFCLPSVVEGFGIVIIEALSLKTPFVAAEIPPVVEASGRKGGLFYEPKNYKELSECLLKILTDDELHSKLEVEGYEQSKNYTKEVIGAKLNTIFNNLKIDKKIK
ncbi:glycosyltransferase family 4 protein [uncultured Methanosphaera sp.]|uniref:glycosyltransferase family 4 protein n=1 Tax=uncultured Methanosphaera sp. TaxID=262501 RepID=UPI000DC45DA7|nr:glycosyltransferase family 4 protein [uncultured Methanosphaera sp.]RAP45874.1 MAG: glycosyltransferase [Methanosphaera sp. SHI1033]